MTVYYYYLGFNRNSVLHQGSRTLQVGLMNETEDPCKPASPFFFEQGDEIGFRVVDITPIPPPPPPPAQPPPPPPPDKLTGLLSLIFTQANGWAGTPFGADTPPSDPPETLQASVSVLTGIMFTKIINPPCTYYRSGTVYEVELYDGYGRDPNRLGMMVDQPIPVFPVPYPGDDKFMRYAFTAMLRLDGDDGETFPWTVDPEMEVGTT